MEYLALLIAILALIAIIRVSNKITALASRIAALEAENHLVSPALAEPPLNQTNISPAPDFSSDSPAATSPSPPATATTLAGTTTVSSEDGPASINAASPTPSRAPGLEERIGTRWVVWIGGLTLALGGLFMVRYSIEQGLIGPGVRMLLGGLFASALLAAGEWTRRKETISAMPALPIANIPAILTAAGTVVAFGTIYASYALYDFLAPATAFIVLGMVALGTLAAALLHGAALAGLGLVAAFATPILVSSNRPDYWALYVYIAIVTGASFGLARVRLWRWLVSATLGLALLWTLPCLECGPSMVAPHLFHAIAGFLLASALVVCGFLFGPPEQIGHVEPVSSGSLTTYLLASALIVLLGGHTDATMIVFSTLVIATLAIAWRAEAATAAVCAAAALVTVIFFTWAVRTAPNLLVLPGGAMKGVSPLAEASSISAHVIAAGLFALMFGMMGFRAQGRSTNAIVPTIWAATATFIPITLLIALYYRIAYLERSIPFAIIAVILAGAFAAATDILTKRPNRPGLRISTALFATGTLAALALALTFALEKGWLTIALALMCTGAAWISMERAIPFLRELASILAGIVVLRIGYEPSIAGNDVGATPIFNWILWGYGIPAVSFWTAGKFLRRRGDDVPLRVVDSAAILFTAMLAFMEIRHSVNPDIYSPDAQLAEIALRICTVLAMAIGLEWLRIRTRSVIHNIAAVVLAVAAVAGIAVQLLMTHWPIVTGVSTGGIAVNLLLLCYALPALLALLLSYAAAASRRHPAYSNTIAATALILALAYVSLEVRRFYHGPILTGLTSDAEQYAYSVVWLLFGVILLVAGFALTSLRARLASALVIGLTVLKVFAIDMSVLTGVYRAVSFIGLGLVLVSIGWLYQRVLLTGRTAASGPDSAE